MKALSKLKSKKGLWLTDAPVPDCAPDEVLIKIKKTAICGTDLHIYKWNEWAKKTVPVPMIIGHEFMGVVVDVGKSVSQFKKGDRVSGEGHLVCGHCRNCRAGHRHLCRNTKGIGYHCPGVFAEYFSMPSSNVYKIPDNISDDLGAILDPYGNAMHAASEFNMLGEDILITGAGPVGMMAAAIATHSGARYVVVADINDYRLSLVNKIQVTRAVNPNKTDLKTVMKTLGMTEGFDIGLEMSGSSNAFEKMLDVLNYGAGIAFMGIPSKPFSVDWNKIIFKSLKIHGIYGRRMFDTWYKGIAILQSGLDISPVITAHYPVEKFKEAFQLALSGQSGKVILEWE